MSESGPSTAVMIFAKAPLAGYAKTRLIPALGAVGAAEVAKRLLRNTVLEAVAAELGPVTLAAAPDVRHPAWAEANLPAGLNWQDQGQGDLGERLAYGAHQQLLQHQQVLLIGTDCPGLTAHRLREAAACLVSADACMIPVSDGGYALLGIKRFDPLLFAGIPWSTSVVAAETRNRCSKLGWSLAELPELHDVDEPEDLCWLTQTILA